MSIILQPYNFFPKDSDHPEIIAFKERHKDKEYFNRWMKHVVNFILVEFPNGECHIDMDIHIYDGHNIYIPKGFSSTIFSNKEYAWANPLRSPMK